MGWRPIELSPRHWAHIPDLPRPANVVAIMGSVSTTDPQILNGILGVAAFDVLTLETNPQKDEPEGNAYHLVFQKNNHPKFPYILHGPFRDETIVDHWFDATQLDRYWQ